MLSADLGAVLNRMTKSRYHLAHGTLRPPLGSVQGCLFIRLLLCRKFSLPQNASRVGSLPSSSVERRKKTGGFCDSQIRFSKTISIFNSPDLFDSLHIVVGKTGDTGLLQALPAFAERKRPRERNGLNAFVPSEEVPNGGENNIIIHGTGMPAAERLILFMIIAS